MKKGSSFPIRAFIASRGLCLYFRNFEESEDELRNEVVESLENLATSQEEGKKEEASNSSTDIPGEKERTSMPKSEESSGGSQEVSNPS